MIFFLISQTNLKNHKIFYRRRQFCGTFYSKIFEMFLSRENLLETKKPNIFHHLNSRRNKPEEWNIELVDKKKQE